jgi:hypothetical protein
VSYQPIENYGIIGDLSTVALVGLHGSIEFKEMKTKQLYLPDTSVPLTRFLSSEGVGEVTYFMPVDPKPASGGGKGWISMVN